MVCSVSNQRIAVEVVNKLSTLASLFAKYSYDIQGQSPPSASKTHERIRIDLRDETNAPLLRREKPFKEVDAAVNYMPPVGQNLQVASIVSDSNFASIDLNDLFASKLDKSFARIDIAHKVEVVAIELVKPRSVEKNRLIGIPRQCNLSPGDL